MMEFIKRLNNIFMIDTKMMGFEHYQSAYIVKGKETVLIDSGMPPALDAVRAEIQNHGFSINDISKILVTHCEHPDHAGNVGAFVKENPRIKVYINPDGLEYLLKPEIEDKKRRQVMLPRMADRFGTQLAVPRENIEFLNDGDELDLGEGEKLRIRFTPAHQPSGFIIFESKNNGLFINDIVGNYFADIDFHLVLTPPRSDVLEAMKVLNEIEKMPIKRFYLGHFGISEKPTRIIEGTKEGILKILNIAEECISEGKPQEIEPRVLASKMPEVEKLKKRSRVLFEYTRDELITHHSTYFAQYYIDLVKNKDYRGKN